MVTILSPPTAPWGFYAHRLINRHAVFSLPPEMIRFYKAHLEYISENAVNPDRRRYAVKGEAEKHYLDADAYGDSAVYYLPRYWQEAVEKFGEDTLRAHGIAPWSTYQTFLQLIRAFESKNTPSILRISADLGHYIGDIHVPLHTTKNYNGQLTGQYGIHGFWETRIPELFADGYSFFVGKAEFIPQPQLAIWDALVQTHEAVDSVLRMEKSLNAQFPENRKYSFEERGGINTRVYSKAYTQAYHHLLDGQVERQMVAAIKMIADMWFTAWILAGQPNLDALAGHQSDIPSEQEWKPIDELKGIREHDN
ncbi:hypothetical protein ADIS_3740 [Lunatimonas lonarensis]|uniref:S1/P1 Nuclease n=1 Tax=Lunatimonas lonarensis TaxID=1232681 RepID=R7ZP97_9BACT|nr:zinc dependent phospholipase C family protein [Lunatimonas lonarensis]EON75849.1 hypothetical protein ADIS_3740 [Lunatimonas lonarensis]